MAQRRSIRGQEIRIEGSPADRDGVKAQLFVGPEIIRAYSAMSSSSATIATEVCHDNNPPP